MCDSVQVSRASRATRSKRSHSTEYQPPKSKVPRQETLSPASHDPSTEDWPNSTAEETTEQPQEPTLTVTGVSVEVQIDHLCVNSETLKLKTLLILAQNEIKTLKLEI